MLAPAPTSDWSLEEASHLLNRAGFGAPPGRLHQWHSLGRDAAVEKLVAPPASAHPGGRPSWFSPERYRDLAIAVRNERLQLKMDEQSPAQEAARQRQLRKVLQNRQQAVEAAGWWLDRMATTPDPLVEKLVLFWHGHFATSIDKVKDPYLMFQQNELFRGHALGSARDLTKAVVRDPAMMIYLDSDQSVRTKPNENFARELMELFTLGEGNFTEPDVREAARAFTGLKINRMLGRSFFHDASWDDGPKEFLGAKGAFRADDIVDVIFSQPQCARFLAAKLCAFFVSDAPSDGLVDGVAAELRRHDFALRPVLRALFRSAEFYAPAHRRAQIKSPVQFLIQMRQALELATLPRPIQLGILQQLGQVVFRPPNVAGWDGGRAWINTNTLLARYNIAGFVVKGVAGGYRPPLVRGAAATQKPNRQARARLERQLARQSVANIAVIAPAELRRDRAALLTSLAERLYQSPMNASERQPFEAYLNRQEPGELSDETITNLLHLMMSTPQYQLC